MRNQNLFNQLHDLGFIATDDDLNYIIDAASTENTGGILNFDAALKQALSNCDIEPTDIAVKKVKYALYLDYEEMKNYEII